MQPLVGATYALKQTGEALELSQFRLRFGPGLVRCGKQRSRWLGSPLRSTTKAGLRVVGHPGRRLPYNAHSGPLPSTPRQASEKERSTAPDLDASSGDSGGSGGILVSHASGNGYGREEHLRGKSRQGVVARIGCKDLNMGTPHRAIVG